VAGGIVAGWYRWMPRGAFLKVGDMKNRARSDLFERDHSGGKRYDFQVKKKKACTRRALSIRQLFAELILRGEKKVEYRSRITHVRGKVLLYAAKPQTDHSLLRAWVKAAKLPHGVILGSMEIVGCKEYGPDDFGWLLANPTRLKRPVPPRGKPQPSFFFT